MFLVESLLTEDGSPLGDGDLADTDIFAHVLRVISLTLDLFDVLVCQEEE